MNCYNKNYHLTVVVVNFTYILKVERPWFLCNVVEIFKNWLSREAPIISLRCFSMTLWHAYITTNVPIDIRLNVSYLRHGLITMSFIVFKSSWTRESRLFHVWRHARSISTKVKDNFHINKKVITSYERKCEGF